MMSAWHAGVRSEAQAFRALYDLDEVAKSLRGRRLLLYRSHGLEARVRPGVGASARARTIGGTSSRGWSYYSREKVLLRFTRPSS